MFKSELALLNKYLIEEYVGFNDKKYIITSMDFSNIHDFFPDVTEQLNQLHDPHLRIVDKLNTKKYQSYVRTIIIGYLL